MSVIVEQSNTTLLLLSGMKTFGRWIKNSTSSYHMIIKVDHIVMQVKLKYKEY